MRTPSSWTRILYVSLTIGAALLVPATRIEAQKAAGSEHLAVPATR